MQLIYATGCVTAVGMDAAQTCAAIRAGLSGIEAVLPNTGEPLLAAPIPAAGKLKPSHEAWLRKLLLRAVRECLGVYAGDMARCALFVALPEPFRNHAVTQDGTGRAFIARAMRSLGLRPSPHSRVLLEGHASSAGALEAADALLARNEIDAALIGGVDSMLNDEDRDRLHDSGRLHEAANPFGLIPGEAAAFFLTGRVSGPFREPAMACVLGAAQAREPDSLRTDRYSVGRGLQRAIDAALHVAGATEAQIEWRITDINGERYRAWESTALLARQYRAWRDGLPCIHLPAFTGDVGCATLPLQVIVSAHGMYWGYAPGAVAVCESSSEGEMRGACLIGPADGARTPPFRAFVRAGGVATASARAVVARQIERLPHELAWLAQHRPRLAGGRETLARLAGFDERIDAHIALLRTTDAEGWSACIACAADAGPGGLFAPTVLAVESGDATQLREVLAAAAGVEVADGVCDASLVDAFGWVSSNALRGLVVKMATAGAPLARYLAAAAMHLHRTPPGDLLWALLDDSDDAVRARALQLAGEVGVADCIDRVRENLAHGSTQVRFRAACAALMLGEAHPALDVLEQMAGGATAEAPEALALFLRAADLPRVRHVLGQMTQAVQGSEGRPALRRLIEACGTAGDAQLVPWLMRQLDDPASARIAGEALRTITGLSVQASSRAGASAGRGSRGLTDDPDDDKVAEDEDADLPWPDVQAIARWWQADGHIFTPGVRYFLGRPPDETHCVRVLRHGHQRQRAAAAQHLCLLQPGTPLFPVAAPAWRQRRWLDAMEA
ncbi:TIGR02270 family protein [Variovorax sp. DXTD-1]|uniref:TIGR02270 family protein n=1 Tax=Variovorax sp. DXTD-1 TaxID=2495592 RepID=UPI000F8816B2|nr:TIGR02270 family protein [Variovorax sp. DXTD-1]RST46400.1 TIGR02270 family protein [Variovorax sp. DXTD-1]